MTPGGPLVAPMTPESAAAMAAYAASGAVSYADAGVAESRAMYRRSCARGAWDPPLPVTAADAMLDEEGTALRIYRPAESRDEATVVYLHGGGFVMGDLDTHDSVCRHLAAVAALPVVAVAYPLAPEHPFPAAPDLALGLVDRLAAAGSRLGLDVERLALVGDSAGACLAALASIGAGRSRVVAQCLFYPPTDLHCATASFDEIEAGYPVTGRVGRWFTTMYLGADADADADDWRASPLRAAELGGSPDTLVVTAGHDPLRDEGIAFAERLARERVPVEHRHLPGHVHGFLTSGSVPEAQSELAVAAAFIRARLADPAPRG